MEQILSYISKTLLQHDVSDSGLMYGKMGIAVFFFHYERFTGDKLYRDRAIELINNSVQEQIRQQHIVDYANGLAGVGTGVEYLAQNDYIKVDTNNFFRKFDKRIFVATVYGGRTDSSLFTGLSGLGRYLLFRVVGQAANDEHISTLDNKMLLINITDVFERMYPSSNDKVNTDIVSFLYAMDQTNIFPAKVKRLLNLFTSDTSTYGQEDFILLYQKKIETMYCSTYNQLQAEIQKNIRQNIIPGLYGGLAGVGLYILSKLDKKHETWMQLL